MTLFFLLEAAKINQNQQIQHPPKRKRNPISPGRRIRRRQEDAKKPVHRCRKQHPLAARLQLCRCLVSSAAPSPSPPTQFYQLVSRGWKHIIISSCLREQHTVIQHHLDWTEEMGKKPKSGEKRKAITDFTFCFAGVKETSAVAALPPPLLWQLFLPCYISWK